MKHAALVALVCINAALAAALIYGAATPPAQAQIIGGGADYLTVTAGVAENYDALFVLDLASRQLAVFKLDKRDNALRAVTVRQLPRDFGREAGGF